MQQRNLGGRRVSALGLGGMPMSIEGRPDRDQSIATIHAALDAGITPVSYTHLDVYKRQASVEAQNGEKASMLELYRRALAIRAEHPALGDGDRPVRVHHAGIPVLDHERPFRPCQPSRGNRGRRDAISV